MQGSPLGTSVDHSSRIDGQSSKPDYINKQIWRSTRNLLVVNLVLAIGLVTFAVLNLRYLYNLAAGPFRIDRQTLEHTRDPGSLYHYYCTLKGDRVIDTGISYTEDGKETARYLAVVVDDRILLARTAPGHSGDEFTGALVEVPDDEKTKVISQIEAEAPNVRGAFLPMMMDATDFRGPGLLFISAGLLGLGLAFWNRTKVAKRTGNPGSHPIVRSLARSGDPRKLAIQIDDEVAMTSRNLRIGSVTLTPSFLLRPRLFGMTVVPCDQIVWVYKKVTKHSVNFIPTGKTYAMIVADRSGKLHEFDLGRTEGAVHTLIQELWQRSPWAIAGFSAELSGAWRSRRGEFIAAVDARRSKIRADLAAGEQTSATSEASTR